MLPWNADALLIWPERMLSHASTLINTGLLIERTLPPAIRQPLVQGPLIVRSSGRPGGSVQRFKNYHTGISLSVGLLSGGELLSKWQTSNQVIQRIASSVTAFCASRFHSKDSSWMSFSDLKYADADEAHLAPAARREQLLKWLQQHLWGRRRGRPNLTADVRSDDDNSFHQEKGRTDLWRRNAFAEPLRPISFTGLIHLCRTTIPFRYSSCLLDPFLKKDSSEIRNTAHRNPKQEAAKFIWIIKLERRIWDELALRYL